MEHSPGIIDCLDNSPQLFSRTVGVVITHLKDGLVKGELSVSPSTLNCHGTVHGGALSTLADTVAGTCASSRGGDCVTASSSMEFLRPARGSKIFCCAAPKKMGRSLAVIQVVLSDETGKTVATGTFSFFMLHHEN